MTIGERIKFLRDKNGMTQADIAKKLKIATQSVFKYEKNIVTNIPMENIEKLAEIFGVTPAYIMGWEDNPDTEPLTTLPRQTGEHLFLTPTQQKILSNCQQLNETGQKKVLDFSDDLISSNNYAAIGREQGARIAAYGATETEEDIQPPIEEITT